MENPIIIIVTGASGYLGSGCLSVLAARHSLSLFAVDKREPRRRIYGVRWIIRDLAEDSGIAALVRELPGPEGADREIWLHFAGLFPKSPATSVELHWEDFERDNIRATLNIARLVNSRGSNARLFFPSTALLSSEGIIDDIRMRRYADSKLECERMLTGICASQTASWRLLRIVGAPPQAERTSAVSLPEMPVLHDVLLRTRASGVLPDDVISTFLTRATENSIRPVISVTNCDFVRTYTHISDLLSALSDLIDSDAFGPRTAPPAAPSPITLESIGRVVQEGLRSLGVSVGLHATPAQVRSIVSPSSCAENQWHPAVKSSEEIVRRATREYIELASEYAAAGVYR